MILDGIFNGGSSGSSPSEPPSGGQPATDSAPAEDATPADEGEQADPIYTDGPGDIDDGTYTDSPQAEPADNAAVETPADDTAPTDETDAPPSAPDEAAPGEAPVSEAPEETGPTTPAPAAPSLDDNAAQDGVRDFVAPLLADLDRIRQRQTESGSTGIDSASRLSRNRAVAALQDQLTSRLIEGMKNDTASSAAPSLLDDGTEHAAQPDTPKRQMSLVNRWYAEA